MKKKKIFIIILVIIILAAAGFISRCYIFQGKTAPKTEAGQKAVYYCPMHPGFISDKPGNCMICGMTLVKKDISGNQEQGKAEITKKDKKVLYYRNPMNPAVTSPVPMKDQMGMDYVPVYAMPAGRQEEEASADKSGIYISPERQQLIGVKKEKVQTRKLTREILTVGKVAYDPDLYVAQEEYLQALKTVNATKKSVLASVTQQSNSLLNAAERKLLLLGMTKEQIEDLAKRGAAQENLYLPTSSDSVWVYMTVYEYEMGLVKEGMTVEIETIAFPGEIFTGRVLSITPVLDPMTRSVQARAEVKNPGNKLKPEMFVDVKINVDLGEKLAVSEEAVINTGKRTLVVVSDEKGHFPSKEVTLGQRAEGFYEVLEGLSEGEIVVTSGNFLIDSESKLKSALEGVGHQHGQ